MWTNKTDQTRRAVTVLKVKYTCFSLMYSSWFTVDKCPPAPVWAGS